MRSLEGGDKMKVHTNIILDDDILDNLKIAAIKQHTTISKIISKLVENELEKLKNQQNQ